MRSATFFDEDDGDGVEAAAEAEDREIRDFEWKDREGRRWIWAASLWRLFATAIVLGNFWLPCARLGPFRYKALY